MIRHRFRAPCTLTVDVYRFSRNFHSNRIRRFHGSARVIEGLSGAVECGYRSLCTYNFLITLYHDRRYHPSRVKPIRRPCVRNHARVNAYASVVLPEFYSGISSTKTLVKRGRPRSVSNSPTATHFALITRIIVVRRWQIIAIRLGLKTD